MKYFCVKVFIQLRSPSFPFFLQFVLWVVLCTQKHAVSDPASFVRSYILPEIRCTLSELDLLSPLVVLGKLQILMIRREITLK